MESSETSSSDHSSTASSSDSTVIPVTQSAPMLNISKMSFAPQRSESEMKMIEEATSSLLNTFDRYRPLLIDTQYAYFCKYATDVLNAEMDKKARKANKHGMDNTTINMLDSASVAGSVRSGSTEPLRQFYPSNIPSAQNPWHARAPSVASSFVGDYAWQPPSEPLAQRYNLMLSGHSSGYCSSVPSYGVDSMNRAGFSNSVDPRNPHRQLNRQQPVDAKSRRHKNETLMRAVEETVEVSSSPEQVQKRQKNRPTADSQNRHARSKLQTPSTSRSQSADSDHTDEQPAEKKGSTAVPKQLKGVIKLLDWHIKLIGSDLYVAGTTRDNSQVTSGAVMRYSHPKVVTSKGSFLLDGQPCFKDRTPAYIISACSKGFPRMWKALSRRWSDDRQARRKSTPKKTPERKNTKNNYGTGTKIKVNNSASKAASNAAGTAKASKSTLVKKAEKKPHNKNGCSPSSQSDKENRSTKRRSRSVETRKKDGEASSSVTANKGGHKKPRSQSTVTSKQEKKPLPTEDCDESDFDSPVAAKQTKPKVVKSRSDSDDESDFDSPFAAKQTKSKVGKSGFDPDIPSNKKKKQPGTTYDDEDESDSESDSPAAAKPAKPKVVRSRSNPVVTSKKKKQAVPADESESCSDDTDDDTVIQSSVSYAKRAVQERGSDTSWDTSAKTSSVPKAQSKKPTKNNKGTGGRLEPKPDKKETTQAKPKATNSISAIPKKPSNVKAKKPSNSNSSRPPAAKNDGGSKKTLDLFGDDPERRVHGTDAFSAFGDDLLDIPFSRSVTPNTLVASIQPVDGTLGRFTPPLQNVLHLFSGNRSTKTNSSFGSPSSLNNSRDNHNPVSRRMAKDVEATKKAGKKKRKLPEPEVPGELEDLVKSLKSNHAVKTPNIVKKVFRNQRETDEEESVASDKDESMIY